MTNVDISHREIRFASKLNPADINRDIIKMVRTFDEKNSRRFEEYMLGTIIGKIRGLSFRANPNDPEEPSIALVGVFEAIPDDDTKPLIRSPVCYLPKSVHAMLVEQLRDVLSDSERAPMKAPERGKPVNIRINMECPIKFRIGVKASHGTIGYEFITQQVIETIQVSDALADLRDNAGQVPVLVEAEPATKSRKGGRK